MATAASGTTLSAGLSAGAKDGIIVGAVVAGVIIVGIIGGLVIRRKRRNAVGNEDKALKSQGRSPEEYHGRVEPTDTVEDTRNEPRSPRLQELPDDGRHRRSELEAMPNQVVELGVERPRWPPGAH